MSRVFLRKLIGLGRDEDGAALVITLALLMFMYVTCAGVFAIGQSVKDKIHLQNACDAAAYSAAVVQADTLSRIATINKAMSWTYVQLVRRQMDYIVWKWLEHTCRHYKEDRDWAFMWNLQSAACPLHHSPGVGWGIDSVKPPTAVQRVKVNGNEHRLEEVYRAGVTGFGSGYLLRSKIDDDRNTIEEMNGACLKLLNGDDTDNSNSLKSKIDRTVQAIIESNVSDSELAKYRVFIGQANDWREWMGFLKNTALDECRFLLYYTKNSGEDALSPAEKKHLYRQRIANPDAVVKDYFDTGIDYWYVRSDQKDGFRKVYEQRGDCLESEWYWWSRKWVCSNIGHIPGDAASCKHEYDDDHCRSDGLYNHAKLAAESLRDSYFDGKNDNQRPKPMVLKESYFGQAGTITVGLAKYNENPWYRVFGDAAAAVAGAGDKLGGIFAAFNPHKSVEWTWAFSSAKAGYRNRYEEYDVDPDQPKRAYRVDWANDQNWNLCVSDWDAVFVPVRSARMKAENGNWVENGNEDFLRGWVENGNWQPLDGSARHDYAVAGKMPGLPQMHKSGSGLDWKRLADLLYH